MQLSRGFAASYDLGQQFRADRQFVDSNVAIIKTVKGFNSIDPQVAGKILDQVARQPSVLQQDQKFISQLSKREGEVLQLLGCSLGNAGIAATLFLSEGIVKNYVSPIFSKLGVTDRTQAAILAIRVGLVNLKQD